MLRRKAPPPNPAGASALREYERRSANRRARARHRFGGLGVTLVALTSEPRSTEVWQQGAEAEQHVAQVLERRLHGRGVTLLHDRLIPGRGNIDHLAVGAGGVTVIDTKASRGRLGLKSVGGILTPRQQLLLINGRDRSRELQKLERQLHAVQIALTATGLPSVPITGVLCFPHATGVPLLGTLRTRTGIIITHPRGAAKLARRTGPLTPEHIHRVSEQLTRRFPPAYARPSSLG
jgi:nuclease-like protein